MKLIKLKDDHYVVVDETIQPVNGYYYDSFINKIKSTNGAEYGEASHCWQITHSTEPLEHGTEPFADGVQYVKIYYKIKPISLQEVKELIGVVDVEKKAEEYADFSNDYVPLTFGYKFNTNTKRDYLAGYNQAIEDNKDKKYTEDDVKRAFELSRKMHHIALSKALGGSYQEFMFSDFEEYKDIILALKYQTEWEVEIVDGKLKLK